MFHWDCLAKKQYHKFGFSSSNGVAVFVAGQSKWNIAIKRTQENSANYYICYIRVIRVGPIDCCRLLTSLGYQVTVQSLN